jgi:A/G-specific adenine glycosylase
MELGATVCTRRAPKCLVCPVQLHCEAFQAGVQDKIPPPRAAKQTPLLRRRTLCIRRRRDAAEQWLIEQRPATGRWAGMWQFPTVPARARQVKGRLRSSRPRKLGTVSHGLTHRRYRFDVYVCDARADDDESHESAHASAPARRWVRLSELDRYPLPRPHLVIAQMLRARSDAPESPDGKVAGLCS